VGAPKGLPEFLSVEHYETLRRTSISAPTPEAISVRLAAKVTSGTSGAPPVLGSGVAVAVAVGLAVAVAVGVAVAVAVGVAVAIGLAVAVAVGLAVAVAVAMGLAVAPP
jgi:concentrative nucleoside transporter, CNT family